MKGSINYPGVNGSDENINENYAIANSGNKWLAFAIHVSFQRLQEKKEWKRSIYIINNCQNYLYSNSTKHTRCYHIIMYHVYVMLCATGTIFVPFFFKKLKNTYGGLLC